MTMLFLDALAKHLDRTKLSLRAVAEGARVSYDQLKAAMQRHAKKPGSTNADDAIKVARFFGMTLNEFVEDPLAQVRLETVETYKQLTETERLLLQATGRGLDAQPPSAG